ncbi:MAG: 2-amino-4-hydroxy-6-hydroxymethyldihydropteridine diphosphokinase, partial [Planctomycetota bacterium]
MANCLIACGSNQGDRIRWLNAAVEQLNAAHGTRVIGHSPWLETQAVGQGIRQSIDHDIRQDLRHGDLKPSQIDKPPVERAA